MALSKIKLLNILNVLTRTPCATSLENITAASIHRLQHPRHLSEDYPTKDYPKTPTLKLPNNIRDIMPNEIGRFASDRTCDITLCTEDGAISDLESSGFPEIRDSHLELYDCIGVISLQSATQTNVPKPYLPRGMSTHRNIPGEELSCTDKYVAGELQRFHYYNLSSTATKASITSPFLRVAYWSTYSIRSMSYSTDASKAPKDCLKDQTTPKTAMTAMSRRDRFRLMLRDYGGTLLFVHINISLMCLGTCYMLVTSEIDMMPFVEMITAGNEKIENVMKTSTDFIIAYTVHKLLAPLRISLSLTITPIFVRRLRKYGILKMPKKQQGQSQLRLQPQSSSSTSPPSASTSS